MFLFELFADPPLNLDQSLSNMIANALAPLAASGVPHVSIDAVIDKLRQANTGLRIDRAMAVQLCDPTKMKFVKSIEGDKLILNEPNIEQAGQQEEDAEKKQEQIKAGATKQAQAEIKKKAKRKKPDLPKKPKPKPKGGGPL